MLSSGHFRVMGCQLLTICLGKAGKVGIRAYERPQFTTEPGSDAGGKVGLVQLFFLKSPVKAASTDKSRYWGAPSLSQMLIPAQVQQSILRAPQNWESLLPGVVPSCPVPCWFLTHYARLQFQHHFLMNAYLQANPESTSTLLLLPTFPWSAQRNSVLNHYKDQDINLMRVNWGGGWWI